MTAHIGPLLYTIRKTLYSTSLRNISNNSHIGGTVAVDLDLDLQYRDEEEMALVRTCKQQVCSLAA